MYIFIYLLICIFIYVLTYILIYLLINLYIFQRRKGTTNPPKYQKNSSYDNCSHFWDIFDVFSKNVKKYLLNYVPIYSQMQRIQISYSK